MYSLDDEDEVDDEPRTGLFSEVAVKKEDVEAVGGVSARPDTVTVDPATVTVDPGRVTVDAWQSAPGK